MNKSHISGVMDQLLAEVAKAADELEESLNENLFNFALKDKKMVSNKQFVSCFWWILFSIIIKQCSKWKKCKLQKKKKQKKNI